MKCFFDNKSEGVFLIHGYLNDIYFAVNGKNSFNNVLNNTLKKAGYKTVFFSGTNICNLFCLDEDSANRFIPANRRSDPQPELSPDVLFSDGDLVLGDSDSLQSSAGSSDGQQRIIMKQPSLSPVLFIQQAIDIMENHSKSAIVFTNFFDFAFSNNESKQYQELLINYWSNQTIRKDNLIIFLAPNNSINDHAWPIEMCAQLGWGWNFWDENHRLNPRNCIYVGAPCEDEFLRMVKSMAEDGDTDISNGKIIKAIIMGANNSGDNDEYESEENYIGCAKLLQQVAHDNDLMLKDVYVFIWEKICNDPDHILSVEKISEWYNLRDTDKNPLELLNKPGWEKPYNRLKTFYDAFGDANTYGISNEELNKISSYSTVARLCDIELAPQKTGIPNFILTGNPGVGKTEVARLIGKILNRCGFLQIGHTHEVTKADLVSEYLGGTSQKTLSHIQAANGGVLFIDEAPSLAAKDGGSNSEQTGRDVLREIVSALTNPHYNFCLILSGYAKPMEEVLELEPGLRSRISPQNIIEIDDCSPLLLEKICLEKIHDYFEDVKISPELVNNKDEIPVIERVNELNSILRESNTQASYQSDHDEPFLLDRLFHNIFRSRIKSQFGNAREAIKMAEDVITALQSRPETPKIIRRSDFGESNQKHFIKKENNSMSEIEDALQSFIGEKIRSTVIETMNEIRLNRIEAQIRFPDLPVDKLPHPKSMIFSGHPGTGKTEIARLFGELYYQLQILGNSEIYEVNASEMVGDYIGQAASNTKSIVDKAYDKDALLFIDEAHQLCDTPQYGKNVIDALMSPMTNAEHPLSVIFAVYPDRLKDFLNLNPGLKSRVKIVQFDDYSADELLQIFIVKEKKTKKFEVDEKDEFHEAIGLLLESLYDSRDSNFGNGRVVANILEEVCAEKAKRVGFEEQKIKDELYTSPTVQDIPEKYSNLIEEQKKHREKLRTQENILGELENLSGYDGIKSIIREKENEIKFNQILKDRNLPSEKIYPGHYCFLGNPGCGKSTGASMLASSFYQMGIISGSRFRTCSVKDLVGEYVGSSGSKTSKVLMESLDGVLLIDEAYELCPSRGASDFHSAALTELVAFMDNPDYRGRSCIILAGYPDKMQPLYEANPGLKSRLNEVVFEDYTDDELWDIFKGMCKKSKITISDEETLRKRFVQNISEQRKDKNNSERPNKNFANGRTVRNIFESCLAKRKKRIIDNPDTENLMEMIPDDLQ